MDRRAFLEALALGILAAPVAAGAQQAANIPRIGIMEYAASWEPFLQPPSILARADHIIE